MNQGTVTPSITEFVEHREEVIKYIRAGLLAQGFEKLDASKAVARISMWRSTDIENLYRCINSGLDENVIKAIVAHDFNGMGTVGFLPKSKQFEGDK